MATCGLAVALAAGGLTPGFGNDDAKVVLPSDALAPVIPHFPLPSETAATKHTVSYLFDMNTKTGQFEANPTALTDDWFLTYIGNLDQTLAACQYYKLIGAVRQGCGINGELQDPITFEEWKTDVGLGKHKDHDEEEDIAHFINQVDLNLTRDHHMVSFAPNKLAAYVCNHAGPAATVKDPTGYYPEQPEIDAALRDIRRNHNLVACVAMEYSARGAAPGTAPFTKFWIFNPDGKLVSTVDLDGRGPKGVPHVCTACHGGTFGPATNPDLGAHFLPFDISNFAFSSKTTPAQREDAIFKLNLDVYKTEASRAGTSVGSASIKQLIEGWYGDVSPHNPDPQLKRDYVAPSWAGSKDIYQTVYARSCRTCHVAMDRQAFEMANPINELASMRALACEYKMPNSKVTFDRFWLSGELLVPGRPAGTIPQPDHLGTTCAIP